MMFSARGVATAAKATLRRKSHFAISVIFFQGRFFVRVFPRKILFCGFFRLNIIYQYFFSAKNPIFHYLFKGKISAEFSSEKNIRIIEPRLLLKVHTAYVLVQPSKVILIFFLGGGGLKRADMTWRRGAMFVTRASEAVPR
jgi:hypothetical protein